MGLHCHLDLRCLRHNDPRSMYRNLPHHTRENGRSRGWNFGSVEGPVHLLDGQLRSVLHPAVHYDNRFGGRVG